MSTAQNRETQLDANINITGDGTFTAHIDAQFQPATDFGLLSIVAPTSLNSDTIAGKYYLARCGVQTDFERLHNWGIYFRRPLFISSYRQLPSGDSDSQLANGDRAILQVTIPYEPFIRTIEGVHWGQDIEENDASHIADPGYAWLSALDENEPVNLMGPFGNGFSLRDDARNLLLIAQQGRVAKLLPLVELMLNRGGRVTILVRTFSAQEQEHLQSFLLPLLPIAVELRLAHTNKGWKEQLSETLIWADQVCAAVPQSELNGLTMLIREKRFLVQEDFAQVLVDADLICGVGACLACVVSTANDGHTRACVNGPVFDLTRLSR